MPQPVVATKQMIQAIFDGAAAAYNRTGPSLFTTFAARLVEQMPLASGATALDVATGTGTVLLPLARRLGPQGHVTGIDLSAAMIRQARRAVRAARLPNVDLRKMDAEHLDYPDSAFDAVTCAFGLFLFPDMDAALREMRRVTKPGGHVGVSVFHRVPPPFSPGWTLLFQQISAYQAGVRMPQAVAYTPDEVTGLLERCGLQSVRTVAETSDIVYAGLEDWWAFQLTLGSRASILGMDEATRARFKDEYLARLRPLLQPDGLHLAVGVVYAVGER